MERDNFSYKNNLNAFRSVYTKEGFLGFYKGYTASIFGIFIYHGFSFFIFTTLKEKVKSVNADLYAKWYVDFALGGVSALGQIMAYPFDIVRKRMQGQFLLYEKKEIDSIMNYRSLIQSIFRK